MKKEITTMILPLSATLLLGEQNLNVHSTEAAHGGSAFKYEEPKTLTASIYSREDKQLLFAFKRVSTRSGSMLKVQRDFTYPDGRLAAREQILYEAGALISYELEEAQIGASGSAKISRSADSKTPAKIKFEYKKTEGARTETSTEVLRENTLVGDMIGPFIASNWEALQRGE